MRATLISIVILATLANCTTSRFSKTPFTYIAKAEKLYEKGKYDKALSKLEHADTMHYFICGLYQGLRNQEIALLQYSVYMKLEKYDLARQSLDSLWRLETQVFDSLKVLAYQKEYGDLFLSQKIDSAIKNATIDSSMNNTEFISYVNLTVDSSVVLRFKAEKDMFRSKDEFGRNLWKTSFMNSSAYQLLKYP